ncbi:hypothetical protein F6X40_27750 [Paraburkholderia sp. UCT31]|uniref:hypothetical protein n=1 Tax=Paraburkholderia sp. UCT31 TaxID=2615209 RepID=UPI001655BB56|nr:hypothetical protein [Paraburkholderia sp. UCT31]MBC8740434.1 hypothetical protein [Paraburkholderia sp. UCT31]
MNVHEIANYNSSRDYARLAELAKTHSVLCIVDYQGFRDVAKTIYSLWEIDESWQVGARGIGYVCASSKEDFIKRCESVNLEFIAPPGDSIVSTGQHD